MASHVIVNIIFSFIFYFNEVTPHPNIKGITATERDLRASQGGLYPQWSLMLSHKFVRGVFSLGNGILAKQ
jgi:quinol-cytochrome oxidoreductase complex cytochrome b subunit